jgi:hypothetical protein
MNWEGHDDWVEDGVVMPDVREGVERPIVKPKPKCEAVRERHRRNVYEQTALPGVNCVEEGPLRPSGTSPIPAQGRDQGG